MRTFYKRRVIARQTHQTSTGPDACMNKITDRSALFTTYTQRLLLGCVAILMLAANTGCVRMMANMIYMIKGNDAPAEFKELEEKKVAVLVSTNGVHASDATCLLMARNITMLLSGKVKKIQMVSPDEVDRLVQDVQLGQVDPAVIGSRSGADYVVNVDVSDLKLKEGKTLYKGRSSSTVTVYKSGEGKGPVFRKSLPEFVYPQTGAPVTDYDEATFQRIYLTTLANRIARIFYPYDPSTDVAIDAAISSVGSF